MAWCDAVAICFCSYPLNPIGLSNFVVAQKRSDQGLPPISADLPFDATSILNKVKSHAANDIAERLKQDKQNYATEQNTMTEFVLKGLSDAEISSYVADPRGTGLANAARSVQALLRALATMHQQDMAYMEAAIGYLTSVANHIPGVDGGHTPDEAVLQDRLGFKLARQGGSETELWLEFLVASILSTRAELAISDLNPFLPEGGPRRIFDITIDLLLRVCRVGHLRRCLVEARGLLELLAQVRNGGAQTDVNLPRALQHKSNGVAQLLAVQRHYIQPADQAGNVVAFDPRFLVFEFIQNLVLREAQVHLVQSFVEAAKDKAKGAMCHQMIMGGGKTTVVMPLLALICADGSQLVMQVVPAPLLEMSRSILRERFSALIRKPVFTFKFDRFRMVNETLYRRLISARDAKAVVITDPSSVKSFYLKFIEMIHLLEQSVTNKEEYQRRCISSISSVHKPREQVEVCLKTFQLWKTGLCLMDEVDLILHPLKSELNFPIGRKEPLDLTVKLTSSGISGIRWELPFHLIDALFFPVTGIMTVPLHGSREAELCLQQIKTIVEEGYAQQALQKMPHLVVLSRNFYNNKLKPVLVQWLVIWFSLQKKSGLTDAQIREFLMRDAGTPLTEEMKRQSLHVEDEFMKTINLGQSLLGSFLPFVLSKINRVSFGLLSAKEIKNFKEIDPTMPKSREVWHLRYPCNSLSPAPSSRMSARDRRSPCRASVLLELFSLSLVQLTAVPFVGKDVPSTRSEFAHPDVVIGCTILAYRFLPVACHLRWSSLSRCFCFVAGMKVCAKMISCC